MWGIAPIFTVGTNHKLPSRDDPAKCKKDWVVVNARLCGELGPSIAFLMHLEMFECCNALIATHKCSNTKKCKKQTTIYNNLQNKVVCVAHNSTHRFSHFRVYSVPPMYSDVLVTLRRILKW